MSTSHATTEGFDQYWHHIARKIGPGQRSQMPEDYDDLKAMLGDAYCEGWLDAERHHQKALGFWEHYERNGGE